MADKFAVCNDAKNGTLYAVICDKYIIGQVFEMKRFLHGVRLSEYIDYPNEHFFSTAQSVRIIESLLYDKLYISCLHIYIVCNP